MNKKLFVGAIAVVLSANSFAFDIYKGKIVSHKEWTTGNVSAVLKKADLKSALLKMKKQDQDNFAYSYLFAKISNATGVVGVPTEVAGGHDIYVQNDTASSKVYNYNINVCVNTSAQESSCAFYFDEITLEPGGYFSNAAEPAVMVKFNQSGDYKIFASSYLWVKDVQGHQTSQNTAESQATLTVLDTVNPKA